MTTDTTSNFIKGSVYSPAEPTSALDLRMKGYARAAQEAGKESYFDVPLISHVDGTLWQGGYMDNAILPSDFEYVVSLYPWEQYELPEKACRTEYRLLDGPLEATDKYFEVARKINEYRCRGKTLVHCQAGLNRSALTTALALILMHDVESPAEAIALLREKRSPLVLCNVHFENWLLGRDA